MSYNSEIEGFCDIFFARTLAHGACKIQNKPANPRSTFFALLSLATTLQEYLGGNTSNLGTVLDQFLEPDAFWTLLSQLAKLHHYETW